jgi:alpha-D-xyloside xylohydrolase
MVTSESYTMMRPLVMGFRTDPNVFNIGDQFMFGPALMANPVVKAGLTSRDVYLPAGASWTDFWTGEAQEGGRTISTPSPIGTMPLFVRAGSIVPYGPAVQYASEKPADPIELRVYRGADGHFTLYEDEGDNCNYEKGAHATIAFQWDERKQKLTIGKRHGRFPGMLKERTFNIVWVSPGHGAGVPTTQKPDGVVRYTGRVLTVSAVE